MLPFVAVLLFALMGIAALTVDAGLAFSTQAQLESTGRTLALEHERFRARPGADPVTVEQQWRDGRLPSLERALLGPQAPRPTWNGSGPGGTDVSYSQTVGARFSFAALLPRNVGPDGRFTDGLSVRELLDARAQGGPNAAPTSGGLLASGFRPQAELTLARRPAVRVGAPVSYTDPIDGMPRRLPGLAGVALLRSQYQALLSEPDPRSRLVANSERLERPDGTCVGWTFDEATAAVGGPVTPRTTAGAWPPPNPVAQAYVALVDGNCATPSGEVVAFLSLQLNADGTVQSSAVPSALNASARPRPGSSGPRMDRSVCVPGSPILCVPTFVASAP